MKALKKYFLTISTVGSLLTASHAALGADLVQAYQDGVKNDQIYANALATAQEQAEANPLALALLLPELSFNSQGGLSRQQTQGTTLYAGQAVPVESTAKERTLDYALNLQQPIFNFAAWAGLKGAHNVVKSAYATLAYQKQALISRVASAYFQVLQDQDILRYTAAEKASLYQKYLQADESFKVGTKTITDVYQAKAAYDGAISSYIGAKNQLQVDIEALRVITNVKYKTFTPLSPKLPLVKPVPANIVQWVNSTQQNNWDATATRYSMMAAKNVVAAQRAYHLPTLSANAGYNRNLTHTMGTGTSVTRGPTAGLNLTFPIFNAGTGTSTYVTAAVQQAIAQYEQASTTYLLTMRQQMQTARTSYLSVVSGISQIKADENTIISDRSALKGTEEGYQVGTQTMVDVLDAERTLYDDLTKYAADRYNYLNNSIALKQAAGTLSEDDLAAINSWLVMPTGKEPDLFNVSNAVLSQPVVSSVKVRIKEPINPTPAPSATPTSAPAAQTVNTNNNTSVHNSASANNNSATASNTAATPATTPAPAAPINPNNPLNLR